MSATVPELRCEYCAALLTLLDGESATDAEPWELIRAQHEKGCAWVAEQDAKRGYKAHVLSRARAGELIAELRQLVDEGPGWVPGVRDRIQRIRSEFDHAEGATAYFREKVLDAFHDLDSWCSVDAGQERSEEHGRSLVSNSVGKLAGALNHLPE